MWQGDVGKTALTVFLMARILPERLDLPIIEEILLYIDVMNM